MKVIKEEDLRKEMLNLDMDDEIAVNYHIVPLLKEIDTLTVSKLRPMKDAKPFEDVLTYKKFGDSNLGFIVYRSDDGRYIARENSDIWYNDYQLLGFVPLPIYKPELAGDGE